MSKLPVVSDLTKLLERLTANERTTTRKLAELEDRLRRFEDVERPGYDQWLRVEFGREFSVLEELFARIRERRVLIRRIQELVEEGGLQPREALYVASAHQEEPEREEDPAENARDGFHSGDRASIEARRQAKLEAKRAERKSEKKKKAQEKNQEKASENEKTPGKKASPKSRIVSLYRALARKLHPDSAVKVGDSIPADQRHRLWLEVQTAYDSSDEERLLAVAAWLGDEMRVEGGDGMPALSLTERHDRLRTLVRSCTRLEKKLVSLADHPAWGFVSAGASGGRKLKKSAAREIEDELARAQEAIEALDDFVESIGPPRQPSSKGKRRR